MNQPQQPSSASHAAKPGLPLEVTVVSDAGTTRRLSRVLALARLRSPYTWGFMLLIPLILMSRRFIEIFIAANSPGWSVSGLFLSYFVLLGIAVAMGLLGTAIQMIKRNASIAAYTAPGTAISARFHQDSLELILMTGTTTIPYSQVKDLFAIGGGTFLREQGTRGSVLPRALFSDAALELMERRLDARPSGIPQLSRRATGVLVLGVVLFLGVTITVALNVFRESGPTYSLTDAEQGCALVTAATVKTYVQNATCDSRDNVPETRYARWTGGSGGTSAVEATVTVGAAKNCFANARQEMKTAAPSYSSQTQRTLSQLGSNGPDIDEGWLISGMFGRSGSDSQPRADLVVRRSNACVRVFAGGSTDATGHPDPDAASTTAFAFARDILAAVPQR
ncbi:hypothetical protein [Nocardia aurantiaca]|uniref:Uncharacterized protein n=1 Tax=Nocardia aurantiaca TaxID=2675850 RepID=A0A6I3KSZ7_9NOCA|nr:hypothetical protein [Nocardia aurantiaca]MTE11565.1 hypothetical protein [Nocardia aurantiaca]